MTRRHCRYAYALITLVAALVMATPTLVGVSLAGKGIGFPRAFGFWC